MNQQPIFDIVAFFIFIATLLFSKEVAAVVGPYLVIVIAAAIGASFALKRRDKTSRVSAFWYFMQVVGLAVLFTAGVAAVVSYFRPELTPRATVAPIALVIGFLDWPALLGRIAKRIYGVVDAAKVNHE